MKTAANQDRKKFEGDGGNRKITAYTVSLLNPHFGTLLLPSTRPLTSSKIPQPENAANKGFAGDPRSKTPSKSCAKPGQHSPNEVGS